jgi:hypothetical protein
VRCKGWERVYLQVRVRGEVDKPEIDDELHNLKHGDILLPPDANATCCKEVVVVHDDMHGQIERNGNPGDGGVAEELGEAEEGCCAMMVGVEEGCVVVRMILK